MSSSLVKYSIGLVILFCMLPGCAISSETSNKKALAHDTEDLNSLVAQRQTLLAEIDTMISKLSCDEDAQCDAVAIGHKACGGPQEYLVYSKKHTDIAALEKSAEQHRTLSKKINHLRGAMSDCAMVTKPATACVENRCEAVQ